MSGADRLVRGRERFFVLFDDRLPVLEFHLPPLGYLLYHLASTPTIVALIHYGWHFDLCVVAPLLYPPQIFCVLYSRCLYGWSRLRLQLSSPSQNYPSGRFKWQTSTYARHPFFTARRSSSSSVALLCRVQSYSKLFFFPPDLFHRFYTKMRSKDHGYI